jgi:hypothetical protein
VVYLVRVILHVLEVMVHIIALPFEWLVGVFRALLQSRVGRREMQIKVPR